MRKLAPQLEKWLQSYNQLLEKLIAEGFKATPTNAREGLANLTRTWVKKSVSIEWVQDDLVTSEQFNVPIRIYHPQPDRPLPLLIYFHGGAGAWPAASRCTSPSAAAWPKQPITLLYP